MLSSDSSLCLCFSCVLSVSLRASAFLLSRCACASVSRLGTKGVQESSLPLEFLPETPVTVTPTCLHFFSVAVLKNNNNNNKGKKTQQQTKQLKGKGGLFQRRIPGYIPSLLGSQGWTFHHAHSQEPGELIHTLTDLFTVLS